MFVAILAALIHATSGAPQDATTVRSKFLSYNANRITLASGQRLDLGKGPDVELETGKDATAATQLHLEPASAPASSEKGSKAVFRYRSIEESLDVNVTIQADPKWPILHKSVEVRNSGRQNVRLLNVVLARFPVGSAKTEGGERGFPLYLNRQFFVSVAHPAGFAHVEGKDVVLRQYPGVDLPPGKSFQSMEAVYGGAANKGARKLFVDYVRSRMCRVVLGHDKPYAILESFGGQQEGDFKDYYARGVSASYLLRHLKQVGQSERENGVKFDFYGLEFWHDRAGDLTGFNKANFPNGFNPVKSEILKLGMKPSLWIASSGTPDWTIDLNPTVRDCFNVSPGVGAFCRASEPLNQIYKDGFTYQMQTNKAGLLKFDNLEGNCINPAHRHLPGPLYSTEAIDNAVIDFFATLHRANPNVFIMLYWGYRSPWWLLHGDTYFECGDQIEAASPAQYPTPYPRDSVTQRLDQAQMKITDTPWLGKDSLGVWLSDWTWNSGIGKTRWQEGIVMDMARGGLLFQMWTDTDWLTPPERDQVATFIDLFKANSECFANSKFVLGDPNKAEPYGYRCGNGKKVFLAIHNACLKDSVIDLAPLVLVPGKWDIYRWYPNPKRLSFRSPGMKLAMRPYEVDLFEVVPAGQKPSLNRPFGLQTAQTSFEESTTTLQVAMKPRHAAPSGSWTPLRPASATSAKGATLSILPDGSILVRGENPTNDTYRITIPAGGLITGLLLETLTDPSLPSQGPGRAVNGNFALNDIKIESAPGGQPALNRVVKIRAANADFYQTSFGGWPSAGSIDEDLKTGWSIHPLVGESHAAVFEFDQPLRVPAGTILAITMIHGDNHHNLGHFRFSTTQDLNPLLPTAYQPTMVTISATIPPTQTGGLLMLSGGSPEDVPSCTVGGTRINLPSVWASRSNWGCPWTAWRGEIGPSVKVQTVEVTMQRRRANTGAPFKAYFLPK